MKALLFAGCGARGVITLGAAQALFASGYEYDMIHGSSSGALNAALIHAGKINQLAEIWKNMRNSCIYHAAPWLAFTAAASVLSSGPLARLIQQTNIYPELLKNPKPIYITATNTHTIQADTRKIPLETAELTNQFILASASYPIGLPTVAMPSNDKQASVRLTDGGTMMNYGIIQAIQDGYDDITLINPSFPTAKPIHNLLDMIDFLVTATGSTQLNDETEAAKLLHNANHEVKLTIYSFTAPIPFATLDFNTAGKNYEKYIKIGADLLKQPTLSIRRVIQS